jgi:hypothetical protein
MSLISIIIIVLKNIEVILLSCWYILIAKLTGSEYVSLARMHNGRHLEELAEVIGLMSQYQSIGSIKCTDDFSNILELVGELQSPEMRS